MVTLDIQPLGSPTSAPRGESLSSLPVLCESASPGKDHLFYSFIDAVDFHSHQPVVDVARARMFDN